MRTKFRTVSALGQTVRLSPAQAEAVLLMRRTGHLALTLHAGGYVRGRLVAKGLARAGRMGLDWFLTPLGLAVADALRPEVAVYRCSKLTTP